MNSRIGLLAAPVLLAGCNDTRLEAIPSTRVETHQQAYQEMAPRAVDVLWVIDDSGSMGVEQVLLGTGFQAFAHRFLELGLDFHLGVTSADPRLTAEGGRLVGAPPVMTAATPDLEATFLQRAMLGTSGGPREAGLEAAKLALSPALLAGPNAGFLRNEAILTIVFLSDEDDQSLPHGVSEPSAADVDDPAWRAANLAPVQGYVDDFLGLKGGDPEKLFLASIIGDPIGDPFDMQSTGCGDAVGGFRYAEASAATGFWRSICGGESEFRTLLEEIADEVTPVEPLPPDFATDYEPIPGSVTVSVDGVPVPEDPDSGWQWVPGTGVVFSGATIPPSCSTVTIEYRLPAGLDLPAPAAAPAPGCQ